MSSIGVTGARASVSGKVQSLLKDIKEVCLITVVFVFFFKLFLNYLEMM